MVIDAFIFNDELDMLELRLGELDSVVDKFVFLEVERTFRGAPKPLYYRDNTARYAKWAHKIVHATPSLGLAGSWEFEIIQRNALGDMIRSLNAAPSDTISFSDLDEICNPETIRMYTPDLGLRNLRQMTFYYNFNHLMDYGNRAWSRARIGRVSDFLELGAYEFRLGKRDLDSTFPALDNGGWHGSYFTSDLSRIRRKVHSISHDDLDHIIDAMSDKKLAEAISSGQDIYHRAGVPDATWVDTEDARLPSYFRYNLDKFKEFTNAYFVERNQTVLEGPEVPYKHIVPVTGNVPTSETQLVPTPMNNALAPRRMRRV